jgi:hypothetical protein
VADPRFEGERRPHFRWGGPRPANRPVGGAVMGAPSGVTPGRSGTGQVPSGSTVRDQDRKPVPGRDGSAPGCAGGDVGTADQVAVPAEGAMNTGEVPALGFRHSALADRAGRGRAPLIHQHYADPCLFGFVGQTPDQVPDPPVPDPFVVPTPRLGAQDAARVPDGQCAHPPTDRPIDDRLGGLVLSLTHPLGADRSQLTEHTRPGLMKLAAQGREVHDARQTPMTPPSVQIQHTRPHVPSRNAVLGAHRCDPWKRSACVPAGHRRWSSET